MKKLKILVVEDNEDNINAAKAMLSKHDVTVVSGYDQAKRIIGREADRDIVEKIMREQNLPEHQLAYSEKYGINYWDDKSKRKDDWRQAQNRAYKKATPLPFDVLLTDVKIPKGGYDMMNDKGKEAVDLQGNMPYGAYILLYAIEQGIKLIAMITSGSHHIDPFVYALDCLNGFNVGDIKVIITNNTEIEVEADDYVTPVFHKYDYEETKKLRSLNKIIWVKDWSRLLNNLLNTEK